MNNWCLTCKQLVSGKYCYSCGKESIPAMLVCPHCKAETTVLSKFCGECAKPVQEAVAAHIARHSERGGGEGEAGSRDDTLQGNEGVG